MQVPRRFLLLGLALTALAAHPGRAAASSMTIQPMAYGQERGWDEPPGELNEAQRRGFHDGVEGARRDFGNNRRPDVENREEYRGPRVEPELREAYREGFRRGYETAASHLWVAQQAPPPPVEERRDPDGWGMRGLRSQAERQGYHEGSEAAQSDFQMQRRPDPDDREEFRQPRVPPELVDEYREGFMRGYEVTRSQLAGEPNWEGRGEPAHWEAPERFSETGRRGFHDGVEGAQKDFGNHRRPNVFNREEYRSPRVPEATSQEYREGFRRGYEMAAARLWGGQ